MSGIRIIGIGSPFGDDRIGWDAIEAIDSCGMTRRYPEGAVATHRCSQPATDLLPLLSGASAALLIDGIRSGAAPGTLRKIDASELRADPETISSHGLGVPESLTLARMLGMLPETMLIYGVEIKGAGAEPGIGREVFAAIPVLLREIEADLRRLVREND